MPQRLSNVPSEPFDEARVRDLFSVLGAGAGRRLLGLFADDLGGELRALLNLADSGDLVETRRQAHRLKGAAANFGAARLQLALSAIERAAHAPGASGVRLLAGLLAELEDIVGQTTSAARLI